MAKKKQPPATEEQQAEIKNPVFHLRVVPAMVALIQRLKITLPQSAGIMGNALRETGELEHLQQIDEKGDAQGLGWFQWSGARHVAFLAFCEKHSYRWQSDEASIEYLISELNSTQHETLVELRNTETVEAAAEAFEKYFERAGVVDMRERIDYAEDCFFAYTEIYPEPEPIPDV